MMTFCFILVYFSVVLGNLAAALNSSRTFFFFTATPETYESSKARG